MRGMTAKERRANRTPAAHRKALVNDAYLQRAQKAKLFTTNEATVIRRCRAALSEDILERIEQLDIDIDYNNIFNKKDNE